MLLSPHTRWIASLGLWLALALWPVSILAASEDPIAVIVSSTHAKGLNKESLVLLFKRKKLFWSDGSRAQPVNLPASHPLRRSFSQAVLGHTPEELEKYWNDQYFNGISPPYVLASEEAVLHFVASTPGAIGYVPLCSSDARVVIAFVITSSGHFSEEIPAHDCPH